jgi:hypothetical protein
MQKNLARIGVYAKNNNKPNKTQSYCSNTQINHLQL